MVSTMVSWPSRCVMGISILYTKTSDPTTSSHVLQPIPSAIPHCSYALNPESATSKVDPPAAGMDLGALGMELAGCLAAWLPGEGRSCLFLVSINQNTAKNTMVSLVCVLRPYRFRMPNRVLGFPHRSGTSLAGTTSSFSSSLSPLTRAALNAGCALTAGSLLNAS